MPIVKTFSDGSVLEYAQGGFDKWCIYLTTPNATRHAPLDINYFKRLQQLKQIYAPQNIYKDYIEVYNNTTNQINNKVLSQIDTLSKHYDKDSLKISILFTIIYMGMIAEENKEHTKLGKRIKRLGVHQVLIDGIEPTIAANFSKGMKWKDIDRECKKRGF